MRDSGPKTQECACIFSCWDETTQLKIVRQPDGGNLAFSCALPGYWPWYVDLVLMMPCQELQHGEEQKKEKRERARERYTRREREREREVREREREVEGKKERKRERERETDRDRNRDREKIKGLLKHGQHLRRPRPSQLGSKA